jgi:hypothetical protein
MQWNQPLLNHSVFSPSSSPSNDNRQQQYQQSNQTPPMAVSSRSNTPMPPPTMSAMSTGMPMMPMMPVMPTVQNTMPINTSTTAQSNQISYQQYVPGLNGWNDPPTTLFTDKKESINALVGIDNPIAFVVKQVTDLLQALKASEQVSIPFYNTYYQCYSCTVTTTV